MYKIAHHVLFCPSYYAHCMRLYFLERKFLGILHSVSVDYCSGNGDWIVEQAQRYPQINWVAIEKKFPRIRKIWSKRENLSLANLFLICGEGETATKYYFPTDSVAGIYINFPDPWPKLRHAKHRLIQSPFVQELGRILEKGQSLFFVTDDSAYSEQFRKEMSHSTMFSPLNPAPHYRTEYPEYGTSYFEDLWREKGKEIRYHIYTRTLC